MKKPRITISGERRARLEKFYSAKHLKLSNRVLLQLIEGMLRLDALDESMAFNQLSKAGDGDDFRVFQFRLHEDKYPYLYQQYSSADHGSKEDLFSAYIDIALGLWEREASEEAVRQYIKIAKTPITDTFISTPSYEEELPAAPMPDDEIAELEQSRQQAAAVVPEVKEQEQPEVGLDDIEDHSVFDELDFDSEDDEEALRVFAMASSEK